MKTAIVKTALTLSLVGALVVGTIVSLAGSLDRRRPAATPQSLLLGSDLVCLVTLKEPTCQVGNYSISQAQVLSVVASVWDRSTLTNQVEVADGVTNIYVVTSYPYSERSGPVLLRDGVYFLCLARSKLELEQQRLKKSELPKTPEERAAFGSGDFLLFNVSTQATYSFVGAKKGAVVLNKERLRGGSFPTIEPYSTQAGLLTETYGTNDIGMITNAIWTLSGALCSDNVEAAMAQLSSSSNAITADAARNWPASEMKRRFQFQSSP